MSDLRFDDYADEFAELCFAEQTCLGCLADEPTCPGCLADAPDQHAHMGFGGCLAEDYYNDEETKAFEKLTFEEIEKLFNSIVVPTGTPVMTTQTTVGEC